MRISWNWLSELVDLRGPEGIESPEQLAQLLTQRGLEVESVDRMDQGFDHVVTGQILERKPHPQSDRLSLCTLSLGTGEPLEIVCGAQNMKAGDRVAVAQVGAHLPNGLKIAQSKIRGVVSNGMLCSEEELKLKDQSEGILILPPTTPLGRPLAEILGLNDTLLTLKITANRGDCLSHFGLAREIGAALGKKPKSLPVASFTSEKSSIGVALDAGPLAPQFWGCEIAGVKVGPSSEAISKRLEALGVRSINNIVDATNWVMLEMGQPLHAYDASKIQNLRVRKAHEGEQLPLLDGQTITLTGSELVIADEKNAVGLAGVMGGGNSEVDSQTTRIFVEAAEFDPIAVRRSATRHQRKTEAAHRFERGIDSRGVQRALQRVVSLLLESNPGAKVIGWASAETSSNEGTGKIQFGLNYISEFLGFSGDQTISPQKIEDILSGLDCCVTRTETHWEVFPPSYRKDLRIREDLAEEVARTLGYDSIPARIPALSSSPVFLNSSASRLALMNKAKATLVQQGLNETLNFAFTSKNHLSKFDLTSSVRVLNPLSEEHEYLVPSLLPGLVRNAQENWSHHFGSEPLAIRLFELRPVFSAPSGVKSDGLLSTGVEERWKLALAVTGPRYAEALRSERGEFDFYDLKAIMDTLFAQLGTKGIRFQPLSASRTGGNALFHPGQSVEVLAGNSVAGYFGLFHPAKSREQKTRSALWLAELDWDMIAKLSRGAFEYPRFKPWPQFPTMERDFALLVKSDITSDRLCQVALKAGKPLAKSAKVFDIYRGSQVVEGMTSIAVRVIFYEEGRNLQESEVEAASARILESWKKELGVGLRA